MTLNERLHLQNQLESLINPAGLSPPTHTCPLKLEQVTELCFRWVSDDPLPSQDQNTSITTVLTSQSLASCLNQHIDPSTVTTFRHFLLSATLACAGWHNQRPPAQRLSPSALRRLRCATGSALLQRLDDALASSTSPLHIREHIKPSSSSTTTGRLQAHLVLALGTALGVAYSTRQSSSSSSSSSGACLDPAHRCSPTQWLAKRDRLRGLLARELVALGKALRPDMSPDVQAALERAAAGQWAARYERWTWGHAMLSSQGLPTSGTAGVEPRQAVEAAGGMFCPVPCIAMVAQPEALGAELPRPDASDERKRRSLISVGPWEGQQVYARVNMRGNSGGPGMMV